MKKISKIALVAVVAAMTAFFGCNSEASILEQVAPVSDLQAKALPGLNVVTWKPNAVSNGYTLFANYGKGWVLRGYFDNDDECYLYDYISTSNEWANGQEVKYMIQNDGAFLQRAAYVNKELASSDFVEVSVNAVNPGYKTEVMYKVPAIEEGKAVPDFFNFDYSNAEEIANLVEPTATIETIGLETFVKDFTAAPYLNYSIFVRTPDESDEIEFAWDYFDNDSWWHYEDLFRNNGKASVVTPFVGTNDIYVKISDPNNYYTPKTIKIGSVEVEQVTEYKGASDFNVKYIADDETVEFTWKPVTNIDGSVTEGVNYSIYYMVDKGDYVAGMFKKVPVTPVYDDFDCKFVASAAYADDMKGKKFYLYASKDNKKISENIASNDLAAKEITPPGNRFVSYEVVAAEVDDNKNPVRPKTIKLVFNPWTFNDKYTNKVTYKVYEKVVQKSPADNFDDKIDWTLTDITAAYDNVTKKMVTSSISPKGVTYYKVVAFNAATNVKYDEAYNDVQFWSVAGPTTYASDPWNVDWDGKECEISGGDSGAAKGKAFTIPTFEAYQIETAVKNLGTNMGMWASSVATKATVKIVKEDAEDDGNIPYSLKITAAAEEGYTVYIYKVEEVDGEKVYSEPTVISN